jgi:penicillin G amidase
VRPRPAFKLLFAAAGVLGVIAAAGALAAGLWLRGRMSAGLPRLDGSFHLQGLSAPARVARDGLGVPTVSGASRVDVARATGWLHAQDRFFQMDVLRRWGAGELAELFGARGVPLDKEARMHGFRRVSRQVLARASPERRAIVEAYCEGVNAGLAALGSKPWEYIVLRAEPRPWKPEDCFLVSFAMVLDLQDSGGRYAQTLYVIRDELGPASLAFFAPLGTPGDAPLDGTSFPAAPIPPPSEIDLRRPDSARGAPPGRLAASESVPTGEREAAGSNSFALAGSLVSGGSAMVASDMHLRLGVPNLWYRMSLKWPGHEETGVTIPGTPTLVAGSTGRIAWGFTNSYAGTGDLVVVNPTVSPELYHAPSAGGLLPYDVRRETVAVRGSKPVAMEFPWTIWGPIVGSGSDGRLLAYHWTEDDPAASNLDIMDLENAPDAQAAMNVAHHMGIPPQNFLVADAAGRIGWTIAGLLPRRIGYTGRIPVTWDFGDRRWDGYLKGDEVPSVLSPAAGRLWTANNRLVGGQSLAAVGDSGYFDPARARQIRDDLDALVRTSTPATPRDLLSIQLDDRALFLERWRTLLLGALSPERVAGNPARARLLEAVQSWEGRASVDSASYPVVRAYRLAVARRILNPLFAPCVARLPQFTWATLNYEQALESILEARPAHLLDPSYKTWDDLLVAGADDVASSYAGKGLDPRTATWGQRNTARIEHPLAAALPHWAAGWLSMPATPLAGDTNMPRVQGPSYGASERFVVSPGHEAEGIFHMPGGQSANPLSPYFRAGYDAWVRGDPTPFLPGPAEHTLDLAP